MDNKLISSLEELLSSWYFNNENKVFMPTPWIGNRTFEMMAIAAASVLIAVTEAQDSNLRDGLLAVVEQ
jgi:hypothetical protein